MNVEEWHQLIVSNRGIEWSIPIKTGDIYSARVIAVESKFAVLNIAGVRIEARTDFPVTPGMLLGLKIKSVSPQEISFQLMQIKETNNGKGTVAEFNLFKELGLKADPAVKEIIKALGEIGRPLDKGLIQEIRQLFHKIELPLKHFSTGVRFFLADLPLDKELIGLVNQFLSEGWQNKQAESKIINAWLAKFPGEADPKNIKKIFREWLRELSFERLASKVPSGDAEKLPLLKSELLQNAGNLQAKNTDSAQLKDMIVQQTLPQLEPDGQKNIVLRIPLPEDEAVRWVNVTIRKRHGHEADGDDERENANIFLSLQLPKLGEIAASVQIADNLVNAEFLAIDEKSKKALMLGIEDMANGIREAGFLTGSIVAKARPPKKHDSEAVILQPSRGLVDVKA